MNGKGSARRPAQVSQAQIDANWERVFGDGKKAHPDLTLYGLPHSIDADESRLTGTFYDGSMRPSYTGKAQPPSE